LCERWQKLALVVLAEPLLELGAGELARRLDHRSLAVDPFGLDRVEPRASARQPADQKAATMAGPLDLAIVPPDPVLHLAADVPGGVVPDQRQDPDALGRELLGGPGEEGAGQRADRSPVDEAQQRPLACRQPQAVAGQGLRLRIGAIRGVQAKAQGLARRPGMQRRLRQAGEPDLVLKAERPVWPALRLPDQAVAATFLRA
jgi:hypothetical protein